MTLNQVKKVFEDIATNHKQINSFGYGDVDQINISGNTVYPLMYVVLSNGNVNNKNLNIPYNILLMDIQDNNNQNEIESDMLQIAMDVRATLINGDYEFRVDENSPI